MVNVKTIDFAAQFDRLKSMVSSDSLRMPILIFAAALILRLLFMFIMFSDIGPGHLIDLYQDPIKYVNAADYLFGRADTGQYELFLVGVGYPFLIALLTAIFGDIYWPILVVQLILSSLSCVLIYKIGELLIKNRIIAAIAGFLAAVSITSISLANAILSETLFFFLFILSLYLFFKGLADNRWSTIIFAGIMGGLATLVRSVTMFYPVLLIVFALIYPVAKKAGERKRMLIKSAVVALIMITIPALWGLRNLEVHDTFTVSGTGVLATKTYLTGRVLISAQDRHVGKFTALRDSLYRSSLAAYEAGNYRQNQADDIEFIISTVKRYPSLFLKNYLLIVLDNATAVSGLQYLHLPRYTKFFENIDKYIHRGSNSPVVLVFSLIGFLILARKQLNISLILLLNVLYFALMSGITFGQGSRIFFPAMSTQSILAATAVLFFYDIVLIGRNFLFSRRRDQAEVP